MQVTRHKVYAYIVRGVERLVFRQVGFPEADIQVPGSTLEQGELPMSGVMREAFLETGLSFLCLLSNLGKYEWWFSVNGDDELYRRHFYHLGCAQEAPDSWQHEKRFPSDGSSDRILFDFSWVPLKEAAAVLHPYYTAGLDALVARLSKTG